MRRAVGIVGLMMMFAIVTSVAAQVSDVSANTQKRAQAVVDHLVKMEFAPVLADFNAPMKTAMSEDQLRSTWTAMQLQAGAFKARPKSRYESHPPYNVAFVTCEFAQATIEVQVVFDADWKIAGLSVKPAAAGRGAVRVSTP